MVDLRLHHAVHLPAHIRCRAQLRPPRPFHPGIGVEGEGAYAWVPSSTVESGGDNDDDGEDKSEDSDELGSAVGSDDEDSRGSNEEYDRDSFCASDGSADDGADKPAKSPKKGKQARKRDKDVQSPAQKRSASVNSLGTPKKDEANVSVGQGGNVYFGEDELKKWTTGSEKYKQGFNWPAYIHHKQSYDNYCQFKGVHAARTFKSIIHAKLIPALCGFCGLKRLLWKTYEDATVILAIEKALATLPGKLSPEAQSQLVSQSINTLGNA